MNGKGDSSRPFSVDRDVFEANMRQTINNAKDRYREAVASGMFWELFPELTGVWSEDREKWTELLTQRGS